MRFPHRPGSDAGDVSKATKVMRRSKRPWYRRMFQASVLDRLLRALPDVDVLVVASDRPA